MTQPLAFADVVRLWPDGAPTVLAEAGDEVSYLVHDGPAAGTHFLRNISDPTLNIVAPTSEANGVGVVVTPGGGWTINAWSHEGVDVARWLSDLGYTVFLLKYRVQASEPDQAAFDARTAAMDAVLWEPRPSAQRPRRITDLLDTAAYHAARAAAADDGRRAIEIARERAAEFGVRPDAIGMIGFSAGAFLAVDVALDPRAEPLAFVGAIYGGETLGAPVPPDAPPLFSVVAQDDLLAVIVEGLHTDWWNADRPAEHHVFARGGHGFGMVPQGAPADAWTVLFEAWRRDLSR